jgi:hypothetical protein
VLEDFRVLETYGDGTVMMVEDGTGTGVDELGLEEDEG